MKLDKNYFKNLNILCETISEKQYLISFLTNLGYKDYSKLNGGWDCDCCFNVSIRMDNEGEDSIFTIDKPQRNKLQVKFKDLKFKIKVSKWKKIWKDS